MIKPRIAFVSFGAVLLYLGLAVLGCGGFAALFGEPALIALAIATIALTIAAMFTSGNVDPGKREDRSNRWVIAVLGVIGLLLGYVPAMTDRTSFWTLDGDTVRWIGVVLFIGGGMLRLWPVFVLGRRFSGLVAIQQGHELVTSGIYGVVRHPSYLGLLINAFGWALAFRSGIGVILVATMIVPLIARIRAEEVLLRSEFGEAYDAYRSRTWRMIPGLY
jgi:protein-S-isoprenylcysteine O-methyltransferase Ste14